MSDTLTLLPADRWGRIGVERRNGGSLVSCERSAFGSARDFTRAAGVLCVSRDVLLSAVDRFRADAGDDTTVLTPPPDPFSVTVRGRLQSAADGILCPGEPAVAFAAALATACAAPEPLVTWEGRDRLAAVDVDFTVAPGETELLAASELIEPRAPWRWRTRSGGLRLVYVEIAPYSALELAAVALVDLRARWPGARAEVKADTRHPCYPDAAGRRCGPVLTRTATADVSALRLYFGQRTGAHPAVADWLAARGFVVGGRYSHEHCPIQPSAQSGADTTPVMVCEDHVHCFLCEANGVQHGSRTAGRFPFAALTGSGAASALGQCVRGMAHWGHARHVAGAMLGVTRDDVLRALYSAGLKLAAPTDPRIPLVFGEGLDLLRLNGRWASQDGEEYRTAANAIRPILERLPCALYVDAVSGELKPDRRVVAKLEQPHDLWAQGYPSLTPIWGVRIHGVHLGVTDPTRVPVVMQTARYAPAPLAGARPRYLPAPTRPAEERAWELVEQALPGVPRTLVRLLVAAKGVSEGGASMPPFVVITGPSGAGKTTVVELAAAITGDEATTVKHTSSDTKLRQGIMGAKRAGTYCVFNEFFKDSKRGRGDGGNPLDLILTLTPDSTSHMLYIGPVKLGSLPVCVWTDVAIPDEVRSDVQLTRRLIHCHIDNRHEWEETIVSRIGATLDFRLRSPEHARAADTILSGVVDDFFATPATFAQIAGRLGFRRLSETDDMEYARDMLREFFRLVCAAPDTASQAQERNRGWKRVDMHGETELAAIWRRLRDPDNPGDSRKCREVDWQALCNLRLPAVFAARALDPGGHRIDVRFSHKSEDGYTFNKELQ